MHGSSSSSRRPLAASRPSATWRGAPRLPAGLALVALCLFGMIALPSWSAEQSGRLRDEIRQNLTPVEVLAERLHREVLDLANDFRGYLITNDPSFLSGVDADRQSIDADFERLRSLAARARPSREPQVEEARQAYEHGLVHSRVAAALAAEAPRPGDSPASRRGWTSSLATSGRGRPGCATSSWSSSASSDCSC